MLEDTGLEDLTVERKALKINLDNKIYGSFAEIGAGQEVARYFFKVGGAAGTVAKTISAYDMTFSDEIYGKASRYVSRDRLVGMLDHEYRIIIDRLSAKQGAETTFFVFANTVSARNYQGTNECHGWMGVRFQSEPLGQPNEVIIHVRMTDKTNLLQQQALGIIGVNLLYSAYYYRDDADRFVSSLLDSLSTERLEVDLIDLSGKAFESFDDRLMSLKLVQKGLTNAVMFSPENEVLQPAEALYKRGVLLTRGSFRPVTKVHLDMVKCAEAQFEVDFDKSERKPVAIFEMTLSDLSNQNEIDTKDFLTRVDTLTTLGYPVLITNYPEFFRLTDFLRRYTAEPIAMVLSIKTLVQVLDHRYYERLEGGLLEALGRLFGRGVRLLIYPVRRQDYIALMSARQRSVASAELPEIVSINDVEVQPQVQHLFAHLRESGSIEALTGYNKDLLSISGVEVLKSIRDNQTGWENFVPEPAAKVIKEKSAFGYYRGN